MSDLIKRLHGIANNVDFNLTVYAKREIRTGADEIERLTATVDEQHIALKELAQDNDKLKKVVAGTRHPQRHW